MVDLVMNLLVDLIFGLVGELDDGRNVGLDG